MNNRAVAFLALLISIGIVVGYVYPTWNGAIAETKAAIKSDDEALAAAKTYKDRENELLAARDAMDPASLARLSTFLPDSVSNVGLILDLNALAANAGFSLSSIDVSVDKTAQSGTSADNARFSTRGRNEVGSIDMSISAVGTYNAFLKFLEGLEYSQRVLDVRDVSISSSENGIYTYQMTVRLYWLH